MRTLIKEGNTLEYKNAGADLDSGDVVAFEDNIGVCYEDIPTSASGTVLITKEHKLPAVTGVAFNQGITLYWDVDVKKLTNTSTDNVRAGMCAVAKGSAEDTANVILGR